MMRTGLSAWLSVTGEKLTQVLYSIEDGPFGRRVRGTRTGPGLSQGEGTQPPSLSQVV
jgi:hypothetical protein